MGSTIIFWQPKGKKLLKKKEKFLDMQLSFFFAIVTTHLECPIVLLNLGLLKENQNCGSQKGQEKLDFALDILYGGLHMGKQLLTNFGTHARQV
jgi:hypothetical protein